ncbi:MAG: O-phosphoseryl-tRNA(Sec) selenium transferase [Candidatus Lokiarchaeota archaeon]|nr:O-phosphoseryl-tRNA(Sec) selenium transferase [Candidatus Lokiarchaeota archaeon]
MKEFDLDKLFNNFIPEHMKNRGILVFNTRFNPIKDLLEHRVVPDKGWKKEIIEFFFNILSSMDTDKDTNAARIGEREARVASTYVGNLAENFCHGIGRGGRLIGAQPKAPGASILQDIGNRLALSFLKKLGTPGIKSAIVVPMATGMSISLILAELRDEIKGSEVIYPRADHRSPLKGIEYVGLEPIIIEGTLNERDGVIIPPEKIEDAITDKTAAILSTTSFFPPRECDDVKEIAKIAKSNNIPHIINNAYGAQNVFYMKKIQGAIDAGRVDGIIQSTDKNFLTPVGGAIISSPNENLIERVAEKYAGRANAAPIVQFVAAVLTLGYKNYLLLQENQRKNRNLLQKELNIIADKHEERVLEVENPISCAITINSRNPKSFGGVLYKLRVTGSRAIEKNSKWGPSLNNYPDNYISMSSALGVQEEDILIAFERIDKAFQQTK